MGGRPPWALWGPKGPRRARGASQGAPQARGNTGKRSGAIFGKPGFWVPGGPPSNPEKLPQNRLPSLRDLSQSIRAAFLVQVGVGNPSRASVATHFVKILSKKQAFSQKSDRAQQKHQIIYPTPFQKNVKNSLNLLTYPSFNVWIQFLAKIISVFIP